MDQEAIDSVRSLDSFRPSVRTPPSSRLWLNLDTIHDARKQKSGGGRRQKHHHSASGGQQEAAAQHASPTKKQRQRQDKRESHHGDRKKAKRVPTPTPIKVAKPAKGTLNNSAKHGSRKRTKDKKDKRSGGERSHKHRRSGRKSGRRSGRSGSGNDSAAAKAQQLLHGLPKPKQARGRVQVGEEGYHSASLGPPPPPMAASQAFPKCRYTSLPAAPISPCRNITNANPPFC